MRGVFVAPLVPNVHAKPDIAGEAHAKLHVALACFRTFHPAFPVVTQSRESISIYQHVPAEVEKGGSADSMVGFPNVG
jgi:hypothetical protein